MLLIATAVSSAAFLLQACSEKGEVTDEVAALPDTRPEVSSRATDNNSLSPIKAAMLSIGANCDDRKRARSGCKWQDVSYTLNEPDDWSAQITIYRGACESNVFSDQYNVVSDGQSWIVNTANGAAPTTKLHLELVKQTGLSPEPKLVKLCDL